MPNPSYLQRIESLPTISFFDSYMWADYAEILCLLNIDKELSKEDLLDRVREREGLGELPTDDDSDLLEDTPAEINDRWTLKVDDWFLNLKYRATAFKECYPFVFSNDSIKVKADLGLEEKFYISLLLSSNLNYFSEYKPQLTSSFEKLSQEALREMMPQKAIVHIFGSNSLSQTDYQGNIWSKVNKLAKNIKASIPPSLNETNFPPTSTGDKGLDVVAWIPFDDDTANIPIYFGQCACSPTEWVGKQHSSNADAWQNTIGFSARPANVAFIPICFRLADGLWPKPQDVGNNTLIDRVRFTYLLRKNLSFLKKQSSYSVVEDVLNSHQSIF